MDLYYKYRSLENLRWFLEILLTNRLYSCQYFNLNGPMEGRFLYDPQLSPLIVGKLKTQKSRTFICSLSRNHDNNLMWAMYANSHRGCCIEVEVTTRTWTKIDVTYSDEIININEHTAIEDILGVKSKQWQHEEETRFIRTLQEGQDNNHLSIKIKKIYLGNKLKKDEVAFYRKLIHRVLGNEVPVEHVKVRDLYCGYK